MPGSGEDEMAVDSAETPDWTGRAKGHSSSDHGSARMLISLIALEFLSRTLDFLDPQVLKPSQGSFMRKISSYNHQLTSKQSSSSSPSSAPCLM